MTVGINIPLDEKPWQRLKDEIKDIAKKQNAIEKQQKELGKKGQQLSDDQMKEYKRLETRKNELKRVEKEEGPRLKHQEKFNAQQAKHEENFNIKSMLSDRVEGVMGRAVRSNMVQGALKSKALGQLFQGTNIGGDLAAAARTGGMEGLLAKATSTFAAPVAAAVGAFSAIPAAVQQIAATGNAYSESYRQEKNDYAVKMADAKFINSDERELERRKMQLRDNEMGYWGKSWFGTVATLGISNLRNAWNNRQEGLDAYSREKLETEVALRKMGAGTQSRNAGELAEQRVWADYYGSQAFGAIARNTWGKVRDLWGSNADAEERMKKRIESAKKQEDFTKLGDTRAIEGDFTGAFAAFEAAAKEGGGNKNWRNPLSIWVANEAATKAAAGYAMSVNPLGAIREGY